MPADKSVDVIVVLVHSVNLGLRAPPSLLPYYHITFII